MSTSPVPRDRAHQDLLKHNERLGDAATYSGQAYDAAVKEVLDIMVNEGRVPVDAIRLYRARHTAKVRESVRSKTVYTVTSFRVPKAVLDVALELADGDLSRLRIAADGSVTVMNKGKERK